MAHSVSTPQQVTRASEPSSRLSRAIVVGAAALGAVLLLAALVLWVRYGTAVFFEMIASGFAACF